MDDQLFGHHADNPGDRWTTLQGLASRTAELEGCLLVDLHDYVFDDVLYPGWAETYRRLWQDLLDRGCFWFGTPCEVAEHWATRYDSLVRASRGLKDGMA
jgi:hypothetical protein